MILKTAANMQEHGYIETGKEGGYYEVDGQRTEIGGGGGDSRFSTCEVEVFLTLNGEPLTLDNYAVSAIIDYNPGNNNITDPSVLSVPQFYAANANLDNSSNKITPILFNGVAYVTHVSGYLNRGTADKKMYVNNRDVQPIVTGNLSIGTFNGRPVVIVRGDGTVTFEMMEDN